jgi:hypothetical protein
VGTRVLDEGAYADWDAQFQEAAAQLEGRDEAIDKLVAQAGVAKFGYFPNLASSFGGLPGPAHA